MAENKLRTMIETGKLDDLINNEKDKLCELRTSEEVLALLAKYSYHEPKEIFENELLDLLKNHVDDAELSKASGGVVNKRNLPSILGSVALAGTMFLPVRGENLPKTDKRSNSIVESFKRLAPDVKMELGSVLVPGLPLTGVLLYVGCKGLEEYMRTVEVKPNKNADLSSKIQGLLNSTGKNTGKNYEEIIKEVPARDLASYAVWELTEWKKAMKDHYEKINGSYKTNNKSFVRDWNGNLDTLKKARFAVWLFGLKKKYYNSETLRKFVKSHTTSDDSKPSAYPGIFCENPPTAKLEELVLEGKIKYYGLRPIDEDGGRDINITNNVLLPPISQHMFSKHILTQRLCLTIMKICKP